MWSPPPRSQREARHPDLQQERKETRRALPPRPPLARRTRAKPKSGSRRRARTCTSTLLRVWTTATRAPGEAASSLRTAALAPAGWSSSTAAGPVVDVARVPIDTAGVGNGCAVARTLSATTSAVAIARLTSRPQSCERPRKHPVFLVRCMWPVIEFSRKRLHCIHVRFGVGCNYSKEEAEL